ncbi:hypothetical protein RUM43_007260 [Polyplax serrata]|uniref:Uncharacterized protein n=1 Tax=Polyplax serrata TaxID=468196 RepID=A0AAN8P8B0_POLSC
MSCIQLNAPLRFLLVYLLVCSVNGAEKGLENMGETGYLYEKPVKSLLVPGESETEIPASATEKAELGQSTETVKEEVAPEEINLGPKPETKSLDGYLPPEKKPLYEAAKENLESALDAPDEGSKNPKQKFQIVKRKVNFVKDKEKVKVGQF